MNQRPKKYTCPACHGKGCRLCQGKGTLYLTTQQVQKVKSILQKMPKPRLQNQPVNFQAQKAYSQIRYPVDPGSKRAGLLTILALTLLIAGGAGSYAFLKSLKPFFAALITLLFGGIAKILWGSKYVKPKSPNDFIAALEKPEELNETQEVSPLESLPPNFL